MGEKKFEVLTKGICENIKLRTVLNCFLKFFNLIPQIFYFHISFPILLLSLLDIYVLFCLLP